MKRLLSHLALALCLALPLGAEQADAPAMLVADQVYLEGKTRLVAEGRVEALSGETRILAQKITYDRTTGQLSIDGPIRIEDSGTITVLASSAEMDAGFQNAVLKSARVVLDQQVQLAAYQMNRVNGRYSQLYKTAVTSCHICNDGTPPLWQIRARRVIHDQAEKQLYFEGAQLRVKDVPVFYLPYLRLPDPSLKRATGFMIPALNSSTILGTGIRLPFFIRLGDHRDLTVTPYLSTKARTLELQYRQAFKNGSVSFDGALSRDDQMPGDTRAYLFAEGAFELAEDYKLSFDLQTTLDESFLVDYGYSSNDRLASEIALTRAKRNSYTAAALVHYRSLRVGEINGHIPSLINDLSHELRLFPAALGGELRLGVALHSHFRYSDTDTDADGNGVVDGRDVVRLGSQLSWQRSWTTAHGLHAKVFTGLAADQFYTYQDANLPKTEAELTPMAALALRWPLAKRSQNGAYHVLEPFVQFGWVGGTTLAVANDESTRVEFDEGNLLDLTHFPSPDRRERGQMITYGLTWARTGPRGGDSRLTFGQILRQSAQPDFSPSSGLAGETSDLLLAGQMRTPGGLALTARTLLDSDLTPSKAEARATWQQKRFGVGASYVWLDADASEDRADVVAELSLDGLYRFSRHWAGTANMRYDVTVDQAAEAGLGLEYRNECVKLDLSLSRRFTSSTILSPSTEMSLTVGLLGFNASSRDDSYTRQCKD